MDSAAKSVRDQAEPSGATIPDSTLAWVTTRHRSSKRPAGPPIRLADIFCGCGGLTLGVREASERMGRTVDIRLAVDVDDRALGVYRANLTPEEARCSSCPVETIFNGHLGLPLTRSERKSKRDCGSVDLVVAGPPCQGHSDLNNSTRRNDPRNQLYLKAARAIAVLRPKFAFIENVPSVVHDKQSVVKLASEALREAEYHVTTGIVSFLDLGLPQRRRRHLLLASLSKDVSLEDLLPKMHSGRRLAVGAFLKGLEDEPASCDSLICRPARMTETNRLRVAYLFKQGLHDLPDSLRPTCHRDKAHTYQSVYGRMHWSKPAPTITSGFGSMGQGRYVHPRRERLITPHEAARLQGFPDFFDFSHAGGLTALRTMIGNAVPPPLMIWVVGALLRRKLL